MSCAPREPCGNEECDRCYPQPRFIVRTDTVRHMRHQRRIKAATTEEALAIYNQGTEWPSSYDEHVLKTLERSPTEVLRWDELDPESAASWAQIIGTTCYHDIADTDLETVSDPAAPSFEAPDIGGVGPRPITVFDGHQLPCPIVMDGSFFRHEEGDEVRLMRRCRAPSSWTVRSFVTKRATRSD